MTPFFGLLISVLTEKIKINSKTEKVFRIVGSLIYYPAITLSILSLFFFYQESKTVSVKTNFPDSIKIKKHFSEGKINKVVFSRGILLAELNSGKFELIDDSLIYKSYTSTPQIKKLETKIQESGEEIRKMGKVIDLDLKEKKKPYAKILKYDELIKMHNLDVYKVNNLINIKKSEYKSYKVEQPSWWYFKGNRTTIYFFIFLLCLSVIGKYIIDIGKRKI